MTIQYKSLREMLVKAGKRIPLLSIENLVEILDAKIPVEEEASFKDGFINSARSIFQNHNLKLEPVHYQKKATKYHVIPVESWADSANKIRLTINATGKFNFICMQDFLRHGHWTYMQAVSQNMHWMHHHSKVVMISNSPSSIMFFEGEAGQ